MAFQSLTHLCVRCGWNRSGRPISLTQHPETVNSPQRTLRAPGPPPPSCGAPREGLFPRAARGGRTCPRGARRHRAAARPPPRASPRSRRPAPCDRASAAAGAADRPTRRPGGDGAATWGRGAGAAGWGARRVSALWTGRRVGASTPVVGCARRDVLQRDTRADTTAIMA